MDLFNRESVTWKFKQKKNAVQTIIKASHRGLINIDEMKRAGEMYNSGVIKPIPRSSKVVKFTGDIGVPVCEYLKNNENETVFWGIAADISEVILTVSRSSLEEKHLVLDSHYIFYNQKYNAVKLFYLPLESNSGIVEISSFYRELIHSITTRYNSSQVPVYLLKFNRYLQDHPSMTPEEIILYCAEYNQTVKKRVDLGSFGELKKGMSKIAGYDPNDEKTYKIPDEEATDVLDYDEAEETTLLQETELENKKALVCLLRQSTNEVIQIDKPVFRIGKEKQYADYTVHNNNLVSRNHAEIIVRNGDGYVKDLNSKNGTYINGQRLQSNKELIIHNGDELRLANESFIFQKKADSL